MSEEVTQQETTQVVQSVEQAQGSGFGGLPEDIVPQEWIASHLSDPRQFIVVRDGQKFLELPPIPLARTVVQRAANAPFALCRLNYWNMKREREEPARLCNARVDGNDMTLHLRLELIGWPPR